MFIYIHIDYCKTTSLVNNFSKLKKNVLFLKNHKKMHFSRYPFTVFLMWFYKLTCLCEKGNAIQWFYNLQWFFLKAPKMASFQCMCSQKLLSSQWVNCWEVNHLKTFSDMSGHCLYDFIWSKLLSPTFCSLISTNFKDIPVQPSSPSTVNFLIQIIWNGQLPLVLTIFLNYAVHEPFFILCRNLIGVKRFLSDS